jgi:hypothetical protein
VICSANVDFVDTAAIACAQTSLIRLLVLFYRHTILFKRCGLFAWLVPGRLQGRREWPAFRLPVDCVEKLRLTLTLVKISLQFCGGIRGLASLAKLLLAWFAGLPAVVVGALGDPWVARRGPYFAGLSAKYRGTLFRRLLPPILPSG